MIEQQAGRHRIRILLRVRSGPGPICVCKSVVCRLTPRAAELVSCVPVLHTDIDVSAKKIRDLRAGGSGKQLRSEKTCTEGIGFFQHELLAAFEPGHRH